MLVVLVHQQRKKLIAACTFSAKSARLHLQSICGVAKRAPALWRETRARGSFTPGAIRVCVRRPSRVSRGPADRRPPAAAAGLKARVRRPARVRRRGGGWGAGWQVGRGRGRGGYGAANRGAAAAGAAAWCGRGGLQLFGFCARTDGRTHELKGSQASAGPRGARLPLRGEEKL